MPEIHKYIGFVVVAVFAVGWIWGLGTWILRRPDPGGGFWTWLTVAQLVAGLQALIGIILLLLGYRPGVWLHYVYGFGPLLILAAAHWMAREGQRVRVGREAVPRVDLVRGRVVHLLRPDPAGAHDRPGRRLTSSAQVPSPAGRTTSHAVQARELAG